MTAKQQMVRAHSMDSADAVKYWTLEIHKIAPLASEIVGR